MNARQIGLILAVPAAAGLCVWTGCTRGGRLPTGGGNAVDAEAEANAGPVATVSVAPIEEGSVDVTATALGTVDAAPGRTRTYSVPFDARVMRVRVVEGQEVEATNALVELEPSPDAVLQLELARQERDATAKQRELAEQRLAMGLGTRQDVLSAEQAFSAAELTVHSMEARGMGGRLTLTAETPCVVSHVDVHQGQIVAAGEALVETVAPSGIVARLGVDSRVAGRLRVGGDVQLEPVREGAAAFRGTVLAIGRSVSPETRLVRVYVAPPSDARLLLNEYVRGRVVLESAHGLVVPAQAILPEGDGYVLYTVADGRAAKHSVALGPADGGRVLVKAASSLHAGLPVVIVGNGELEDGMFVQVESPR